MHSRNVQGCYFQISCKHSTMRVSTWSSEVTPSSRMAVTISDSRTARQPRVCIGARRTATHFERL